MEGTRAEYSGVLHRALVLRYILQEPAIFILFTGKCLSFSASYLTSFQATQEADGFSQAFRNTCFYSDRFLLEKLLFTSVILLQGVLNFVSIYGEMIH